EVESLRRPRVARDADEAVEVVGYSEATRDRRPSQPQEDSDQGAEGEHPCDMGPRPGGGAVGGEAAREDLHQATGGEHVHERQQTTTIAKSPATEGGTARATTTMVAAPAARPTT